MERDVALELACFLVEKKVHFTFTPCKDELLITVELIDLQEFVNLLGDDFFNESYNNISCNLKKDYVTFDFIIVIDAFNLYDNNSFMKIMYKQMNEQNQKNFKIYVNRLEKADNDD